MDLRIPDSDVNGVSHTKSRVLPVGTVTFLFTDIEGSTRLLDAHAADYAWILAHHRELIRLAFAAEEGVEVDTTGDALFFVFPSAVGAVRAAAAAQRALASTRWPGDASVRVRMGLHTGEGRRGVEGYVGVDVHRGARVGAAAHGGQVLLSEASRSVVERDLPAGCILLDLGHHRLKDFDRPERLTQLLMRGLQREFPPPRALKREGLPARLTRFIGRETEVEELRARLRSNRLVTLTGPGGTGKTRLALAVASAEEPRYLDGATFVDLSPLIDPTLVPSATASRVEAPASSGRSPTDAVTSHLADRQMLLILDNFEQVLPAAPFVNDVLAACPEIRVLATSRAPLRLEGEQEWPVAPLSLPGRDGPETLEALESSEAVQLFTERARSVQPSFALNEDNASAVVDICRRLDGIPLAIELAAARIRFLSPAALGDRLTDSIDLGSGGRDQPERQRTLRNTIAWSVDLLEEPDRLVFRRLAVFRGGWTLDAAESVVGGGVRGTETSDGLERLLERSLIRSDGSDERRGSMLETIRAFAVDELRRSGELAEYAGRHAEFFLALAEQAAPLLIGPDREVWLERLDRDYDNARAAIRWATEEGDLEAALRISTALMTFWHLRNRLAEGRSVLDALLGSDLSDVEPGVVAGALAATGELAVYQNDWANALGFTTRSLLTYREIGDALGTARQLNNLGWATSMGDGATALSLFGEALQLARDSGVGQVVGNSLVGAATIHVREGRLREGRALATESIAAFESVGEHYLHVFSLISLGRVDDLEGLLEAGLANYADGLRMAWEAGAGDIICSCLDAIANLLLDHGHPVLAVRLAAASERRLAEIGGFVSIAMIGMELPMARAPRMMDAATFEHALLPEASLSIDDAVQEALAFARQVANGIEIF